MAKRNKNITNVPVVNNEVQPQKETWGEYLMGSDPSVQRVSNYEPQQVNNLNQLAQMGMEGLKNNPFNFGAIEDQARKNFNTKTVPTIANRFLAGDTRNSSGFQEALGSSSADLENYLAQLKNQYGQQEFDRAMQMLGIGLQPQSSLYTKPGKEGAVSGILKAGGTALSAYLGDGGILGAIASLFSRNKGGSNNNQSPEEPLPQEIIPTQQRAGFYGGPRSSAMVDMNPILEILKGIAQQDQGGDKNVNEIKNIIKNLGTRNAYPNALDRMQTATSGMRR
jgi:hypothetical protein